MSPTIQLPNNDITSTVVASTSTATTTTSTKSSRLNIPRSDSGHSSGGEDPSDYEVENLINVKANDSGVGHDDLHVTLSPKSPSSRSSSSSSSSHRFGNLQISTQTKRKALSEISNKPSVNSEIKPSTTTTKNSSSTAPFLSTIPRPPSPKVPRFQNASPTWCSITNNLLVQYKTQSIQTLSSNPSQTILNTHPDITPKMRAILIDWLIEVCEVHNMHRQTFYLGVTYLDTYLLKTTTPISRTQLQLLGITCLFIAAKLEEIYPAKLTDLAFLTDGACEEQDILAMELIVLKVLNWKLHPTTLLDWLALFLQQAYFPESATCYELTGGQKINQVPSKKLTTASFDIIHQYFPDDILVQMMQLCDIVMLDLHTLDHLQQNIAASILYHFSASSIVQKATGFKVEEIKPTIQHVTRFALAVKRKGFEVAKRFEKVHRSDWANIQTHNEQYGTVEAIDGIFDLEQ